MAVINGSNGSVYVGADKIGELNSYTITVTQNTEETFGFGDTWVANTATSKSWSVEASGYHDPDDTTGQAVLIEDILTGDSSVTITVRTEGDTSGDDTYSGTVILTEVSVDASADGIIGFSFSGNGNGALTAGTVA
jgi:predicted secreted protein